MANDPTAPPKPSSTGSDTGQRPPPGSTPSSGGTRPERRIALGQRVDLTQEPGYPNIRLTVVNVTRDSTCPHGPRPRLGQYLALDLIVGRTSAKNDTVGLTTLEWVALAADGTATKTHGLSGYLCHQPAEQFPLRFGAREEVRGQLMLDVPANTATISATVPWDTRATRLLIPADRPRGGAPLGTTG